MLRRERCVILRERIVQPLCALVVGLLVLVSAAVATALPASKIYRIGLLEVVPGLRDGAHNSVVERTRRTR
jgi:hypothetical protein